MCVLHFWRCLPLLRRSSAQAFLAATFLYATTVDKFIAKGQARCGRREASLLFTDVLQRSDTSKLRVIREERAREGVGAVYFVRDSAGEEEAAE